MQDGTRGPSCANRFGRTAARSRFSIASSGLRLRASGLAYCPLHQFANRRSVTDQVRGAALRRVDNLARVDAQFGVDRRDEILG